uniref:Secreted protein n=1 Tax=Cacopsylla melanoneura TaxID=428564 RepID=A0A8D8ZJJ8_9HEMI
MIFLIELLLTVSSLNLSLISGALRSSKNFGVSVYDRLPLWTPTDVKYSLSELATSNGSTIVVLSSVFRVISQFSSDAIFFLPSRSTISSAIFQAHLDLLDAFLSDSVHCFFFFSRTSVINCCL